MQLTGVGRREGEEKIGELFIFQVLMGSSDVSANGSLLVGIHNEKMIAFLTCTCAPRYCMLKCVHCIKPNL
jgi:hypothetical protein